MCALQQTHGSPWPLLFVQVRSLERVSETQGWLDANLPTYDLSIVSPRTEEFLKRITRETKEALDFHYNLFERIPRFLHIHEPEVEFEANYASDVPYIAAIRKIKQRQTDNFMYHLAQYFQDYTYQETNEHRPRPPDSIDDERAAIQHFLSKPWLVRPGSVQSPECRQCNIEKGHYRDMLKKLAGKFNFSGEWAMWGSLSASCKKPSQLNKFVAEKSAGRLAGQLVDDLRYVRDIKFVDGSLKKVATKNILDFAAKHFDEFEWYPNWKLAEWKKGEKERKMQKEQL